MDSLKLGYAFLGWMLIAVAFLLVATDPRWRRK